jgi:hypothetical protein
VGGGHPADEEHRDFREWKNHDAYKKALGRLLRDLKAL